MRLIAVQLCSGNYVFCKGGRFTGAVFNPALAFSIQFPCPGNTFAAYGFVYWMGPILGENDYNISYFDLFKGQIPKIK